MLEDNSEKLTLNISVVDLGKIDYLVSQGFYGNRTDFLRSAVKRQLDGHESWMEREFIAKNFNIGIVHLSEKDLENEPLQDYVVLGSLSIDPAVTLEKMRKVFRRLMVFGRVKCSAEIKAHYGL